MQKEIGVIALLASELSRSGMLLSQPLCCNTSGEIQAIGAATHPVRGFHDHHWGSCSLVAALSLSLAACKCTRCIRRTVCAATVDHDDQRRARICAAGTESPAHGADADKRALLLMRRLILEREEVSLSELEQELRKHGLEMEEGGMSLEEVLQYLSDQGYAAPHQWLVADAVRVRGSERVQERVVMLV